MKAEKYTAEGLQAARLRRVLRESGLSGSELAKLLGVTPGAVSHWLMGRRACPEDMLNQIAKRLSVDREWLLGRGRTSKADSRIGRAKMVGISPSGEVREGPDRLAGWKFRPAFVDGGRDFGNPNVFATPADVNTLVRETGQNTNDASAGGQVRLSYTLIDLTKGSDAYVSLMRALGFDELEKHLRAAATGRSKLATRIRGGLKRLETEGRIQLLRIEDSGTTGLVGEERDDDQPFAALVRDNLNSSKPSATAGGSFGLGKATLWRCSDLSSVVFGSYIDVRSRTKSRLIAKTELGFHTLGDARFAGPGWLVTEGTWDSIMEADDLMQGLFVRRDRAEAERTIGTSIVIVGFRDPQAETSSEAEVTLKKLAEAAAVNFWPAVVAGDLEIEVGNIVDGEEKSRWKVNPRDHVPMFCEALERHREDRVVDELKDAGDVVRVSIPLRIPATRPDMSDLSPHPELNASALLLVRLADADATQDEYLNTVALTRGAGMVVRYWSRTGIVVGGRPFHGILLAGRAVGSQPSSTAAEQFLRLSEPPAHNKWEFTDDLREKYRPGSGRRLKEFEEQITQELREIIRPAEGGDTDEPEELKRLLSFETTPPPALPPATLRNISAKLETDGTWRVEAQVHVNDRKNRWEISPRLAFDVESGSPIPITWKEVTVAEQGISTEGTSFFPDAKTRRFTFRGSSDPRTYPVEAHRCRVKLNLQCRKVATAKEPLDA